MLTANEIRGITFPKAGHSGYKADDVNYFIEEVASTIEEQEKNNAQLIEKLKILAATVEDYRAMEDSVKSAIISAQKAGNDIIEEAKVKAQNEYNKISEETEKLKADYEKLAAEANEVSEKIIADANAQAKKILDDAEKKSGQMMLQYNYIKEEIRRFKESVLDSYKEHVDLLTKMPATNKNIDTVEIITED